MKRRGFLGWMFGGTAAAVAAPAVAEVVSKFPKGLVQVESEPTQREVEVRVSRVARFGNDYCSAVVECPWIDAEVASKQFLK